jgi:hypothetical protein
LWFAANFASNSFQWSGSSFCHAFPFCSVFFFTGFGWFALSWWHLVEDGFVTCFVAFFYSTWLFYERRGFRAFNVLYGFGFIVLNFEKAATDIAIAIFPQLCVIFTGTTWVSPSWGARSTASRTSGFVS